MFNFLKRNKDRITPVIVKPGDSVTVEWTQIQGTIGKMVCINNDTYTKKLHLRITWDNGNTKGQVESNITFNGSLLSITGGIESTYAGATAFRETYSDLGTGGSTSIDLSTANNFRRQFSGTSTITFSNPPASNAFGFTFTMVNAGGYAITWPASVDWVNGSAPILTSIGTDVLSFFTFNGGTTYYGFVVGKNMS